MLPPPAFMLQAPLFLVLGFMALYKSAFNFNFYFAAATIALFDWLIIWFFIRHSIEGSHASLKELGKSLNFIFKNRWEPCWLFDWSIIWLTDYLINRLMDWDCLICGGGDDDDDDDDDKVKAYIGRAEQLKQQLKPAPSCDAPVDNQLTSNHHQLGNF